MIHNAVFFRLLACHKIITIGVILYLIHVFTGVFNQYLIEGLLHTQNFLGLNFDVGGLPLESSHGLVNQDPGVGQCIAFVFGTGCEQKCTHAGCLSDTDRCDVRFDILHGVINGQSGGNQAAGRIHVKIDVLIRIFRLEKQQLGDEKVGNLIVDGGAKENDSVLQ